MKIAFIGCGHMGSAMIRGILRSGAAKPEEMMATAATEKTRQKITSELGIEACSNEQAAREADILFLAVKPQYYAEVIAQIRDLVKAEVLVVTIAPGKSIDWIIAQFAHPVKVIRMMPNTPALVGEGMTGMCSSPGVSAGETEQVANLCRSFGRAEQVKESQMDTVTAVGGSSPAYVYMLIEAMADGAVLGGMPRSQAYTFAAQAVLGSARMVLETGEHPGVLKDAVCSPGGTTIEAVRVLEEKGLRAAIIDAMKACMEKC